VFPSRQRLAASRDITKTLKQRPYFSDHLVLKFNQTKGKAPRFAVIASTKVSKLSVKRNRMKRQIRECLKAVFIGVNEGVDIAITIKKKLPEDFDRIRDELIFLLNRAFIIRR
jgi:ribonuclease P protein component